MSQEVLEASLGVGRPETRVNDSRISVSQAKLYTSLYGVSQRVGFHRLQSFDYRNFLPHVIFTLYAVLCLVSGVRLFDPMDCSPPGSSVHGILQAKILEWAAMSSSRGSLQPRAQTQVSHSPGGYFTI